MEAVCAVRAQFKDQIHDTVSEQILELLPDATRSREILDKGSKGMFSRSILLRSLFFRQTMIENSGYSNQIIVLSSGLDSKPLSIPELKGKQIFYVDHPLSYEFSKAIFNQANVDLSNVSFVPFDLNMELSLLGEALIKSGVNLDESTLILWEGASYYFEPDQIYKLVEYIARTFKKVNFCFDFLDKSSYFENGVPVNMGVQKNLEFLVEIGEPWKGFIELSTIFSKLKEYKFTNIEVKPREKVEEELFEEVLMKKGQMFFAKISNY